MLGKVILYYLGVEIVLLVGFTFGAVLLFYVQGTNVLSDPGDRGFAYVYLFSTPIIAALIAIPNALKKFGKKE